jgi:hypothetical protein
MKKKHPAEILFYLFIQKLQFTYPTKASIKDVQASGEAFSPQKKRGQPAL